MQSMHVILRVPHVMWVTETSNAVPAEWYLFVINALHFGWANGPFAQKAYYTRLRMLLNVTKCLWGNRSSIIIAFCQRHPDGLEYLGYSLYLPGDYNCGHAAFLAV